MDERDEHSDDEAAAGDGQEPNEAQREQQDPESSAASDAPSEQQPGAGKEHDV